MIGFIDALRVELMHNRTPVFVTTILPAGINTPFFDKSLTRLDVKPRPSPPVYEPKLVADAILYAAEHPVREVYVGGAGRSIAWMKRPSPGLTDWLLSRFSYRPQLTDQPKSDQSSSNLYEHMEGLDRVQGSFSQEPDLSVSIPGSGCVPNYFGGADWVGRCWVCAAVTPANHSSISFDPLAAIGISRPVSDAIPSARIKLYNPLFLDIRIDLITFGLAYHRPTSIAPFQPARDGLLHLGQLHDGGDLAR
jgi:hypothetical protein